MPTTLKISPVTRIEGHLDVQITVDVVRRQNQVVDAKCMGSMFRGFEKILQGRDPRDATHYTQRICGVCPVSHAMAASMTLESALRVVPTDNGRILRNLVLGANYLQSHILHFYHLAAPDYIDTTGLLDMSPWSPRFVTRDMVGGTLAGTLVGHYVQALAMRRMAHQMGALFGGKMPHPSNFVPGGSSETVTSGGITNFRNLLTQLRNFIDDTLVPDAQLLYQSFPAYRSIGKGYGNLLAYGVFNLDAAGKQKLLASGRYTNGQAQTVDPRQIKEYVMHSWYRSASGLNPASGATEPQFGKTNAYSFVKAPRYQDLVHEVGPLARMWINGDYRYGISTMDRIVARAFEAKKVADAMDTWLNMLQVGGPVYNHVATPASATGIGLTEAPRGALGHWIKIVSSKIAGYQVITPTAWNASPRDDRHQRGPIEQALIGTPVADMNQPIEVLRVIHSFDPCLACAVHMVRPGQNAKVVIRG